MARLKKLTFDHAWSWTITRASEISSNIMLNNLWSRILKNTIATTIAVILAMSPMVIEVYGKAAYLGPMTTVFGHPGRRFGQMFEELVLTVAGTLIGISWSMFGLYLSSLVYHHNGAAAHTIRGLFLVAALLFHGFLRSSTPRLFLMVLLEIIVAVVGLTSTAVSVSKLLVTQLLYPILTAVAILLVVNTCLFPEFSSRFLGNTTIETLDETVDILRDAGRYFIQSLELPKAEEEKELNAEGVIKKLGKSATFSSILQPSQWHKKGKVESANRDEEAASAVKVVKLKSLTDAKAKLRSKLESCKAIQQECNFELAFAVLPPKDLKPISVTKMQKLVASTIALIGACESKYALIGDILEEAPIDAAASENGDSSGDESDFSPRATSAEESSDYDSDAKAKKKRRKMSRKSLQRDLKLVKPIKEIESGDAELLKKLLRRVAQPLRDLQEKIDRNTDVINSCLAYAYDVPVLPSGSRRPTGIRLEELDIRVDIMSQGLVDFDRNTATALEDAISDVHGASIDLMPRMETFLISSFLLNYRQAAAHSLEMLKYGRKLVEKRQERHGRRSLHVPKINWRKWLTSGGEQDNLSLPSNARKEMRTGKQNAKAEHDEEVVVTAVDKEATFARQRANNGGVEFLPSTADRGQGRKEKVSIALRLRSRLADLIEYAHDSEDVSYAFKVTIAVFLVTWPAFVERWDAWYTLNRGHWAALQLVLITEVAIGTSVATFSIRGIGTVVGCSWGWAAFEASRGSRAVCVVLLVIGIVPSNYVQLGSNYTKAGMVSIVSMCVVALAAVDHTVEGPGTEIFLKRLLAFLIGGVVALLVEVLLFPVKARTRLVESLAGAILHIEQMQACLAHGVDTGKGGKVDSSSPAVLRRFKVARSKVEGSLTAAETFLPFCAKEPRLKGSFSGLALVYGEILYVLHQIAEKMDNMLQIRGEYGSIALEEFHRGVYPYRRNVAGSVTLILFAVHAALTTKLPLPQFLPSARLAHLRLVNKVRSLLVEQQHGNASDVDKSLAKHIVRQKFLAFQAHSAGQIEVIEYLEELQDLTKLLVGSNEFRSGLLTRPTYREYAEHMSRAPTPQPLADAPAKVKDEEMIIGSLMEPVAPQQKPQHEDEGEIRDAVAEAVASPPATARRRSNFKYEGLEKVKTKDSLDEDGLPRSLQRVRSRRIEEKNAEMERTRSRREEEEAWAAGREALERIPTYRRR